MPTTMQTQPARFERHAQVVVATPSGMRHGRILFDIDGQCRVELRGCAIRTFPREMVAAA